MLCGGMFERWLGVLREVLRAREEEARRLIEELCRRRLWWLSSALGLGATTRR